MRGIAPLWALLLANAVSWVHAVDAETPMIVYPGTEKNPTWTDTKTLTRPLAHPNGLKLQAEKYYNWVRKQPGAFTGRNTGENSLLVAVVYNPKTQKLAASTIPRGAFHDALKDTEEAKKIAPVWAKVRETLIGTPKNKVTESRIDAEDGAYYVLEKSGGFKAASGSLKYGDKTKENSVWITVWGTKHAGVNPQDKDIAQKLKLVTGTTVDLCDNPAKKSPDCNKLANELGVYIEGVAPPPKNNNNPPPPKNNNPPPPKNNQAPAPRPGTPPPAGNTKRPASQSPPQTPSNSKEDKNKKKKGAGKRRAPPQGFFPHRGGGLSFI
ncbi:hypothetical protein PG987_013303 [Apiospora arundinis]